MTESALIVLAAVALATLFSTLRQSTSVSRDLSRLDRKLNLVLKKMNIVYENSFSLSDRVKDLARDPKSKIAAIKAYREETGVGLYDAKQIVEDYMQSLQT